MAVDSACKGCREEYKVTEAQISRILASSMFNPENSVPDEVYQQRLQLCGSCPKLQDGVTCVACGCIIPVIARLKARSCPLPGGGMWGSYTGNQQ